MLIVGLVFALILGAVAIPLIRAGWREWRQIDGTPASARFGLLKDREGRAGLDRGSLILGISFASMAAWIGDGVGVDWNHARTAEVWIMIAGLAVFFPSMTLYWLIVGFNRPKFLVPRQHWGEPGAFIVGWRRWRGKKRTGTAVSTRDGGGTAADDDDDAVLLVPGEEILARPMVGHSRDERRADDGYLYITTQRLIFDPWPTAVFNDATRLVIPLAEVVQADVAPRGTNVRDGSMARRLRVTTLSGNIELFVVSTGAGKAAKLINQSRQVLSQTS